MRIPSVHAPRRAAPVFGLAALALALGLAAGCDDPSAPGASLKGKGKSQPVAGPPPELPAGPAEGTDRAQRSLVTAFAVAMAEGEGLEQTGMVHPVLMGSWAGYGPVPSCALPLAHKLPNPAPDAVSAYVRSKNWARAGLRVDSVRAWAILHRPCAEGAEWGRWAVWIMQDTSGWRVVRFEADGDWYTGP